MTGPASLHEFYAATEADAAAATGVMLALSLRSPEQPLLWVRQDFLSREHGIPYPPGLREFGLDPSRIIFVQLRETQAVLQAALEGARCAALAAVVVEIWGEAKALDLTASRRLSLAARVSGTPVLMARVGAKPCPSAAETRWEVRGAPSRPLAANAPGSPAVLADLLRHRGGLSEGTIYLEWNRDTRSFDVRAAGAEAARQEGGPALSGAVVSLPFDGPAAPDRAAGRHAG